MPPASKLFDLTGRTALITGSSAGIGFAIPVDEVNRIVPRLIRDGRFVRPAPGGDVLRTPAVLPTGRNLHGFDPFRIPSRHAVADGARQADGIADDADRQVAVVDRYQQVAVHGFLRKMGAASMDDGANLGAAPVPRPTPEEGAAACAQCAAALAWPANRSDAAR